MIFHGDLGIKFWDVRWGLPADGLCHLWYTGPPQWTWELPPCWPLGSGSNHSQLVDPLVIWWGVSRGCRGRCKLGLFFGFSVKARKLMTFPYIFNVSLGLSPLSAQWTSGGMNKAESSTLNLQVETLALSTELVICGLSQLMSAVSTLQGRSWGMEERAMKLRCLDLDSPHLQPEVAAKAEAELVNWDMFLVGERQKMAERSWEIQEFTWTEGCVRFNSWHSQIPWWPT